MKHSLYLAPDNAPAEPSIVQIKLSLLEKKMKVIDIIKESNLFDVAHQFRRWLDGVPNHKNEARFIKALYSHDIIDDKIKVWYTKDGKIIFQMIDMEFFTDRR